MPPTLARPLTRLLPLRRVPHSTETVRATVRLRASRGQAGLYSFATPRLDPGKPFSERRRATGGASPRPVQGFRGGTASGLPNMAGGLDGSAAGGSGTHLAHTTVFLFISAKFAQQTRFGSNPACLVCMHEDEGQRQVPVARRGPRRLLARHCPARSVSRQQSMPSCDASTSPRRRHADLCACFRRLTDVVTLGRQPAASGPGHARNQRRRRRSDAPRGALPGAPVRVADVLPLLRHPLQVGPRSYNHPFVRCGHPRQDARPLAEAVGDRDDLACMIAACDREHCKVRGVTRRTSVSAFLSCLTRRDDYMLMLTTRAFLSPWSPSHTRPL